MADRFWVGGTASWDATAGTKWATTDGGAGGAAVPTAADDVYFTAASGAVTVTVSATATCKALNFTGFTGTFAGSSAINVWGSLTAVSGMSWTHSGPLQFAGNLSNTITAAGKTFQNVDIGSATGSTGTWTLQDALLLTATLTVTRGTFTTNNYAVTATSLSSSNSNTRTINLGSSTVTLSGSGASVWTTATTTGLTFNAGTSAVVLSNAASSITIAGGGVTFYNVSISGAGSNTLAVTGGNTFNNFSVTGPASAGVRQITFDSRQTINGTLSTTGTAGNRRVWFSGLTYGLAQTLTINSAPSLTDADFRDIYVVGTAAPISGTRIGDLRGIRGITASTPKTVYWNLAAGGNWSANAWAATSGGAVSTDNFPLAQDTATIVNTGLNSGATITLDSAVAYIGTLDISSRSVSANISSSGAYTVYGNWLNSTAISVFGISTVLTFSGRNTQTITSAGRSFNAPITVDSYGGTVQLADALNLGANALTVTNGTFSTQNYNVTAGSLSSSNSNVRAINLGSSTFTTTANGTAWNIATSTNLTLNAGTSTVNLNTGSALTFSGGGLTYYNLNYSVGFATGILTIVGVNTFNNFSVTAPSGTGLSTVSCSANQTITGTLTCAGATAVRRVFVRSDVLGTQRDLTVGTLVANDCDFRDIEILGAAIGTAPTRAGDCGGNNNITFPSPKTVYWNLAGAQNWSADGWATSSGGTPATNNFPLAQDTAVFDNTGSVTGNISINANWNIGTFDASGRTSAMTLTNSGNSPLVYGDWKFGTGVSSVSTTGAPTFSGRGIQTITSNGVTFGCSITIDSFSGTVQLADALTLNSARTLTLTSGTFDAVTYNVTTGKLLTGSGVKTLKMGSGTWSLSGTATLFDLSTGTTTLYKGTANIVLSDNSTSSRDLNPNGLSLNKLTIGGTTATSTTTFTGSGQFTEITSTKTVAHTIAFGINSQTFGAWTVTGTAGNVVTVTGTAALTIAGARVSGVDYLAMGTTTVSATSPGEFYSGANSTGTGTGIIKTAAPTPVTRYWRGGTGTWDATTTTNWSDTSGGAGGFSVPTSADAVVFDTLSNATAYTVTCTATQLRCGSLTMAGPLTGNVTWAGTAPIAMHDNVTLPATGLTRTYTGGITLSGSATGKTLTTNGVTLSSAVTVDGVGCGWTLGSALNIGSSNLTVTNGAFALSSYNLTVFSFSSSNSNIRTINLGSSTITATSDFRIGTTEDSRSSLTLTSGTSQLNTGSQLDGNNQNFYNVSFVTVAGTVITLNGVNTFNNLSFLAPTVSGVKTLSLTANQTINGTLTLSAGTNATMRTFVQSNTLGTTRTLTCAAFSGTDADFRDITIAGAAAPVSGTRLGDCKGNSGITFDAAKTVYVVATNTTQWSNNIWATSIGGVANAVNFPLAQDTAVIPSANPTSGQTVTINANYNIGTIDMSARTSNTMTLATGSTAPAIYGNWINGTGTTLTGTGAMTFAGRGSQTITSAGRTFTQPFTINTPSGAVTLQDAYNCTAAAALIFTTGTFDANGYNVTLSNQVNTSAGTKTIAIGSGTWTIAGSGGSTWSMVAAGLTVTGTGTISLTSASAKTFVGGGISYSGITLNQGGAGTLTITGNNTFANISNTYKATGATTIAMGTTTQTVGNFTASGEAGRVLTVQGTSASSPATLVLTGGTVTTPDYLAVTGVRAYSLVDTWYAGANSTNNGSLGWYFSAGIAPTSSLYYGSTNVTVIYYGSTPVTAMYYGSTQVF